MQIKPGKLLAGIDSPQDLRKLDRSKLYNLCDELRQFIIDHVSVYGGHFGASLGVVELTTALHYVFNTPDDKLVWDVGHQAYGHKILTGRRDDFYTNRTYGGLAGFPKMSESKYDAFGVGHSSTSISAALGMAIASKNTGNTDRNHIAVIGDGALTGGMAFEAMNHAGVSGSNLLIVLNDNCMSIDPNVGALKEYLTDVTTSAMYNRFRDEVWKMLEKVQRVAPGVLQIASKIENGLKSTVLKQSNLFESLGLRYFGPIDGHDINHLVDVLNDLKNIPGPKILHCITKKGKGYLPAEKDQTKWHAPGLFDKITGEIKKSPVPAHNPPKYQDVFGHTLVELAKENLKIVGITPAMPSGSSMNIMMKEIPDRAYDVGIAEQHAVTFSAGMAAAGMTPFCNIYSTFMQRGFDQVVHDVCIQNLPVVFCLDRAGLVGADGPTHHGLYDIAYLRCIPNMIIASPMNEPELRNLMYSASLNKEGAYTIRYPRGNGVTSNWRTPFEAIVTGKGRVVTEGESIAFLTLGPIGNEVQKAIKLLNEEGIYPAHYDMRFAKPLDVGLLQTAFAKYKNIITVEDGCLPGGFGSAVLEYVADGGFKISVMRIGVPDRIVDHGEPAELYAECGMDAVSIAAGAKSLLGAEVTPH